MLIAHTFFTATPLIRLQLVTRITCAYKRPMYIVAFVVAVVNSTTLIKIFLINI